MYDEYTKRLRSEKYELEREVLALRAIIEGDTSNWLINSWLSQKCDRQRKVIVSLEKRGKGHTKEEREELALVSA